MSSYDVRIWGIRRYQGKRGTTYTVRWAVAGDPKQQTYATVKLADGFRSKLLTAAREGTPFDEDTGLPEPMVRAANTRSWYEHAVAYVDMKWPDASGRHRKGIAEALAGATLALLVTDRGAPDRDGLRHALYAWSFNTTARASEPSGDVRSAVDWLCTNTRPVADLADLAVLRRVLDSLRVRLDGKPAAAATVMRKRASVTGAIRYAVELGHLDSNPLDRLRWTPPKSDEAVDRRVVVNHAQARRLLAAVREVAPPLVAFYACLYYAGLRPAEALHLRRAGCTLPADGWGDLLLTGSTQQTGTAWNDSEGSREDRALKHRGAKAVRHVPACSNLTRILRKHLDEYGTSADGRLFVTRTGRFGRPVAGPYSAPVSTNTQSRVWQRARRLAFTDAEHESPLARRPYDLRHACLSTWLNAGVPPTQVAEWAGHSVAVLMRVYAACVYGQDEAARARITAALSAGLG